MRAKSLRFLRRLLDTPSPSGYEARGQRIWLDYVTAFADETFSDGYGNAVAVLNKGGSPRVMLSAHADEISLTVNFIDEAGFIRVRSRGRVNAAITKAQRVFIHTREGPITGVVRTITPHLDKESNEYKHPSIEDLFIDIGVESKREALRLIRIGDPITLNADFELLRNDLAVARAFDNRIGTFAVAETLRLLSHNNPNLAAEVLAVSNVMEEVGLIGIRQIAYALKPDIALVVDVTHATDTPTVSQTQHGTVKIGKGPVLTHGVCNHAEVVARLEKVAKTATIELQHKAMTDSTGTDADVVFWTRGGIATALISLPNRYMHSPAEVINLQDLEKIPLLMSAFTTSLGPAEEFKIRI